LVYDLKFTHTGVRRWVIRYVSERGRCLQCCKSFYSNSYPTNHKKSGHSLESWAVYQHVALRQSFADIASSINDIFGYCFGHTVGKFAQARLAENYRATVDKMLDRLRSGMLIHADETKVKLKHGAIGYVWAFASTEFVVYFYHPSREGTFVKETIKDFAGVLVGLRAKFLSKHKRDAEAFLTWNAKREVTSEVAQGYKTRIEKYGGRLFTFLDHDGVPWNNNNAENALKLVASRRRLFGTSVSESGLQDYLVFLSIYQTLRRRGISLLRFLLSGETDLQEFVASYRRR
jgi:hypothetical protein